MQGNYKLDHCSCVRGLPNEGGLPGRTTCWQLIKKAQRPLKELRMKQAIYAQVFAGSDKEVINANIKTNCYRVHQEHGMALCCLCLIL